MRKPFETLLLWIPVLVFIPLVLAPPLNHDVAAVLGFSERWFAGERLYVDLVDVNPPLIFVLNLAPAALAAWTGIDGVRALQICLILLAILQWALCRAMRDRAAEGPIERALLDVMPALFAFACGYDFGQRDVLMAGMALPYVLAAGRRAQGVRPRWAVAAALMAGIGFALKPYFLGIPFLVELCVILFRDGTLRRSSFRDPTPWVMAGVWVAYLASIPVFFAPFYDAVIQLVWHFYLALGDYTPLTVLLEPRLSPTLFMLIPLVWLTLRRREPRPTMLCAAAVGALASMMAQHRGWSYHIVPIELFTCALGTLNAARALDRLQVKSAAPILAGLFAVYSLAVGEAPAKEFGYADSDVAELTALLQKTAEGGRVLALSPGIWPIYPALNYAHARLTLRTMNTWILEGAYRYCTPGAPRYRLRADMAPPERSFYDGVIADFVADPPPAVITDASSGIPACDDIAFKYIDYFSRDPRFAALWARYHLAGTAGRFSVYTR